MSTALGQNHVAAKQRKKPFWITPDVGRMILIDSSIPLHHPLTLSCYKTAARRTPSDESSLTPWVHGGLFLSRCRSRPAIDLSAVICHRYNPPPATLGTCFYPRGKQPPRCAGFWLHLHPPQRTIAVAFSWVGPHLGTRCGLSHGATTRSEFRVERRVFCCIRRTPPLTICAARRHVLASVPTQSRGQPVLTIDGGHLPCARPKIMFRS